MSKKLSYYRELQQKCKLHKDQINVSCKSKTDVLEKELKRIGAINDNGLSPSRRTLKKTSIRSRLSPIRTKKSPSRPRNSSIKKSPSRRVPPPTDLPPPQVRSPTRRRSPTKSKEIQDLRLKLLQTGNLPTVIEMCRVDSSWKDQCEALDLWSYVMERDFPGEKIKTFNRYLILYKKNYDVLPINVNFGISKKFKSKGVTMTQLISVFVTNAGDELGLGTLSLNGIQFQADPIKSKVYSGLVEMYFNVNRWSYENGLIKDDIVSREFVAIMNRYFSITDPKELKQVALDFYTRTFKGKELQTLKEDLRGVDFCKIRFSISTTSYVK